MSSTEAPRPGAPRTGPAPGALLLCRAEPASVAPAAQLLRERMLLTSAGAEWSVLVPEGKPWQNGGEPVDRVLTGWATALAVGAPWPVLALWWDADRSGYLLASGFRRPVGYIWLANGTPAGEDEAMRTFAARLGLDPVMDVQSLALPTGLAPANPPTASARWPASSRTPPPSNGRAGATRSARSSTSSKAAASAPGSPGPAPPRPAPWPSPR
jgi:hypothetical protein